MIIKYKKSQIKSLFLLFIMVLALAYMTSATVSGTIGVPKGNEWINKFPMNFTVTPDSNSTASYNVTLYHDVNGNTWKANSSVINVASGTTINFTQVLPFADNNSGYTWGVEIKNNISGETVFTTNVTFRVDTTGPTEPEMLHPQNESSTDRTPLINWTISTEVNFKQYTIQAANDSDFDTPDILKTQLILSRTVNATNFTSALDDNRLWFIRIVAEDDAGNTNASVPVNYTVTNAVPLISITDFADTTFQKDSTPTFAIEVTGQFIAGCDLYLSNSTNISKISTSNVSSTSWSVNVTVNATNATNSFTPTALPDGNYLFGFVCNSTSGVSSGFTTNRTITIDTTNPSAFGCMNKPANNSKSIDHTPQFEWTLSFDHNFGNYTVWVDDTVNFTSPERVHNISTNTTLHRIVDLREFNATDKTWFWKVNVTDKAGNTVEAGNCTNTNPRQYRTDITNHFLSEGWNLIGIMQSGTVTSAQIGNGLGVTWNTISRLNLSKDFNDYNNGSVTNNDMNFVKGDVVFINLNVDTYWENQTWDTDPNYNHEGIFNLTNITNDWTVVAVLNQSGRTMGSIEIIWNLVNSQRSENFTYLNSSTPIKFVSNNDTQQVISYFNNSAIDIRKFVDHPRNFSLNNLTVMDFGEVFWVNINESWNVTDTHGRVGVVPLNRSRA